MKKSGFTFKELLVTTIIIFIILWGVSTWLNRLDGNKYRIWCGISMKRIYEKFVSYAQDNGKYPDPDKWCDILFDDYEVEIRHLACFESGDNPYYSSNDPNEADRDPNLVFRGQLDYKPNEPIEYCYDRKISNYALNPNTKIDSSDDVVLLFETGAGWNRSGTSKILTSKNHRVEGANILFKNGKVKFIKAKNFNKLKWKDK